MNYFGNTWLSDIKRVDNTHSSRYGRVRLDKNEWIGSYPEAVAKTVREGLTSEVFAAYPETFSLIQKLAAHHRVSEESIHITAGVDGAIKNVFEVFTQPGAEVITINPTYAMVDVYCRLFNVHQLQVNFTSDLSLDTSILRSLICASTRLVIIANPNSPTGTVLPPNELYKLCECCNQFNTPILIDEAYFGFYKSSMVHAVRNLDNVIIARTFSKAFGLAGFRVGYMISSPSMISLLKKFRPMYEVTGPSVVAAKVMLDNIEAVDDYCYEVSLAKTSLEKILQKNSISYIPTSTNFIHVDFGSLKDKVHSTLDTQGFLLTGGIRIEGLESYSRVSVGTREIMTRFWTAVESCL